MSRKEKLVNRFRTRPNDFTWAELTSLLSFLGFEEITKGKTSGSRRAFINKATRQIIRLHQPHPGNILKQYQIKEIIDTLSL